MSLDAIMAEEGWVTIAVAARLCGINESTVTRLIESGDLTGTRAGKRRFVSIFSLKNHYKDAKPVLRRLKRYENEHVR